MHQQDHVLEHKVLTGTDAEVADPYGMSRVAEACEKLGKAIVARFSDLDQRIAELERAKGESGSEVS